LHGREGKAFSHGGTEAWGSSKSKEREVIMLKA